jgi:hypothetical protein
MRIFYTTILFLISSWIFGYSSYTQSDQKLVGSFEGHHFSNPCREASNLYDLLEITEDLVEDEEVTKAFIRLPFVVPDTSQRDLLIDQRYKTILRVFEMASKPNLELYILYNCPKGVIPKLFFDFAT